MAEGILAGLGSFGLEGLEGMDLFENKSVEIEKKQEEVHKAPVFKEIDFLLDKSMVCPLCETSFKTRAIKASRAKLLKTEMDLRPVYLGVDVTKYDVVMCPQCGYTALTRYFPTIVSVQGKKIKETITPKFKAKNEYNATFSYDQALERYQLALVNAIVKGAKPSEKAFICLKASWICQGAAEEVGKDNPKYDVYVSKEAEYVKNAYDGFVKATAEEPFPICGMDETTVNYLLAALAYKTDHLDVASKMISMILTSNIASERVKDKARNLKEMVMKKLKAKG